MHESQSHSWLAHKAWSEACSSWSIELTLMRMGMKLSNSQMTGLSYSDLANHKRPHSDLATHNRPHSDLATHKRPHSNLATHKRPYRNLATHNSPTATLKCWHCCGKEKILN